MKGSTEKILMDAGFYVGEEVAVPEAEKLTKEMKTSILKLGNVSRAEIRTLVDTFYQLQDDRKAKTEQIRSIENGADQTGENKQASLTILKWIVKHMAAMEAGIKKCLEIICQSSEVGRWLMNTKGIGPVLAAGLLAYFDVDGREYASQFISYAGLNDNNRPWLGREKSKKIIDEVVGDAKDITDDMVIEIAKRSQWTYSYLLEKAYDQEKKKWKKEKLTAAIAIPPYNKSAKTLMWKVGKSFWWMMNDPDSMYGRLYSERKIYEMEKNDAGEYDQQAAYILSTKNIDKSTNAYKAYSMGKLPDAHINARCMRWVEKIFLSHLFEEMYRVHYDKIPPRYYTLEHMKGEHNKEILPEVPYTLTSEEKEQSKPYASQDFEGGIFYKFTKKILMKYEKKQKEKAKAKEKENK